MEAVRRRKALLTEYRLHELVRGSAMSKNQLLMTMETIDRLRTLPPTAELQTAIAVLQRLFDANIRAENYTVLPKKDDRVSVESIEEKKSDVSTHAAVAGEFAPAFPLTLLNGGEVDQVKQLISSYRLLARNTQVY